MASAAVPEDDEALLATGRALDPLPQPETPASRTASCIPRSALRAQLLDQLSHELEPASLLLLSHVHQGWSGGWDSWFEMFEEQNPNVGVPHLAQRAPHGAKPLVQALNDIAPVPFARERQEFPDAAGGDPGGVNASLRPVRPECGFGARTPAAAGAIGA